MLPCRKQSVAYGTRIFTETVTRLDLTHDTPFALYTDTKKVRGSEGGCSESSALSAAQLTSSLEALATSLEGPLDGPVHVTAEFFPAPSEWPSCSQAANPASAHCSAAR
jgi:hypothetical protein